MTTRVLVTGATGFVAGHCIAELLSHGYAVRATVRDLTATPKYAHLRKLADDLAGDLEFTQADLDRDTGWAEAVTDCAAVLHVASPFPPTTPRNEDDLIRPAVQGTLRVMRAAADSPTVRRVVLTSSVAAVLGGVDRSDHTVRDERSWSNLATSPAYQRSKTLAERAAWDFVAELPADRGLELVVLNPGTVLGPPQHHAASTSIVPLQRLLAGALPGSPRMCFAYVDVRDLAVAHRLALEVPQAAGNRYICVGDTMWLRDVAKVLAAEFGPRGYRVPTRGLPNWLVRLVARFDPTVRMGLYFLDREEFLSSAKARQELGWTTRPAAESVVDTGTGLIAQGLVPTKVERRSTTTTGSPNEHGPIGATRQTSH